MALAVVRGWIDGGPGGASPPRHGSRSARKFTPLLPESVLVQHEIGIAEGGQGATFDPPQVSQSEIPEAADCGLGAFTPPGTSAQGGTACVSKVTGSQTDGKVTASEGDSTSDSFKASEGDTKPDPSVNFVPPGHAVDANGAPIEYRRKMLVSATSVATAVGSGSQAVATATSGSGANATAVSTASSNGGGTAVAVSNANATDGGDAVADSNAKAEGGRNTTVVVDAQAHGPNKSCILSLSVDGGKFTWSCHDNRQGDGAAGSTSQAGGPGAVPDSSPEPGSANTTAVNAADGPPSYDVLYPSWQEALACRQQPNKTNSVQDAMGRLWGYDISLQRPCAYRNLDGTTMAYAGYIQVKWETAPACVDSPNSANSMADAAGRLWGWDDAQQENCAFKNPSSGEPIFFAGYTAVPVEQPNHGAVMAPSAAGPGNASTSKPPATQGAAPNNAAQTAAEEATMTKEAVSQTADIQAALSPNATLADKANAAARSALTVMVASDALHAASNNVFKAAEADTQPAPVAAPLAAARWFDLLRTLLGGARDTQ